MACDFCGARVAAATVTYPLELAGGWVLIEGVPARICPQCGESLFDPDTVARLQQIARGGQQPQRIRETPVFDFAEVS